MNSTNPIVYLDVSHVVASQQRGPGITLRDAFAYLKLTHVTIDYVGSASRNHTAYSISNNEGAQISFCDVTNGLVDGTTTSANGFSFQNCIAVWMDNCMADTVGNVGFFLVGGCHYFYMSNCVASLCGNHGFAIESTGGASQIIQMVNCVASGRQGLGFAPAANGYNIAASSVSMAGCLAPKNTGNGLNLVSGGSNVVVSGGIYRDNAGRGVVAAGTGAFLATGVLMAGNVGGNYSINGSFQHLQASQINSGALVNVTGPASA